MRDCGHESQTNAGTAGHGAAIRQAVSNVELGFNEPPAHEALALKKSQHLSPRGSILTLTTNPLFGIDNIDNVDWGTATASNGDASGAAGGYLDVARGAALEL